MTGNHKKMMECGGPAFPSEDDHNFYHGMTLRDYFAGQVISRLAATQNHESAAKSAYIIADALIVERDKL